MATFDLDNTEDNLVPSKIDAEGVHPHAPPSPHLNPGMAEEHSRPHTETLTHFAPQVDAYERPADTTSSSTTRNKFSSYQALLPYKKSVASKVSDAKLVCP